MNVKSFLKSWCGIQIIDLNTKTVAGWFRIDGAVQEMFDVNIIPKVTCGMSIGFYTDHIKTLVTHEKSVAKPSAPAPATEN